MSKTRKNTKKGGGNNNLPTNLLNKPSWSTPTSGQLSVNNTKTKLNTLKHRWTKGRDIRTRNQNDQIRNNAKRIFKNISNMRSFPNLLKSNAEKDFLNSVEHIESDGSLYSPHYFDHSYAKWRLQKIKPILIQTYISYWSTDPIEYNDFNKNQQQLLDLNISESELKKYDLHDLQYLLTETQPYYIVNGKGPSCVKKWFGSNSRGRVEEIPMNRVNPSTHVQNTICTKGWNPEGVKRIESLVKHHQTKPVTTSIKVHEISVVPRTTTAVPEFRPPLVKIR